MLYEVITGFGAWFFLKQRPHAFWFVAAALAVLGAAALSRITSYNVCYTKLLRSTKIVNRATGEISYGKIPPYSVVVPGTLPDPKGGPGWEERGVGIERGPRCTP